MEKRHSVKVIFRNGDTIETGINGTIEDVKNYYIGSYFNLGTADDDNCVKAENVLFWDDVKKEYVEF